MDIAVLQNQIVIMKALKEMPYISNSMKKELDEQIIYTEARIRAML